MRFENQSAKLLSITKSKAKMYEFGLDEVHHIRLTESPSNLLLMTIGILGDVCREELSVERNHALFEQKKLELRNVARYFDALMGSRQEIKYDYYLCLLGAASYYLADMPGSAIVLSNKLENLNNGLTESRIELLLEWLLKAKYNELLIFDNEKQISKLIYSLTSMVCVFFNENIDVTTDVLEVTKSLRDFCHERGSDRELLLADIVASVIKHKISNSSFNLLPQYTGLPIEAWKPALSKPTFIREFWPAQKLLGDAGVFSGTSAVIQLPTSAGKTKSAELIIRSAFLSGRASVAVIIAPFRSLCREISTSLAAAFGNEDVKINQLNDIPQIDEFDDALFAEIIEIEESDVTPLTVIVATPEKLIYLLRHKPELSASISLVIYDEGHQFDTGSRGVTYELLLTSLKRELEKNTQHVLISAVLSNAESIGNWLYDGEGKVVNGAECLSTERSIAFSSWRRGMGQFHYIDPFDINTEEFFVPRVMESLEIPRQGRETAERFFPPRDDKSLIAAYLGIKLCEHGPVAVFCGQKSSVIKICREVIKPLERIEALNAPIVHSDQDEIKKIGKLSEVHLGSSSVITKAIKRGILPHSANIPNGLRISVEYAMENGLGRCVVCTSTLAQGVNLPIKYLVVSGVFQGEKQISTRDFHNLLGRAGRAGKHTEGSIIFADTELFDQRYTSKRWQWSQMSNLLDPSKSEECLSSLLTLVKPFYEDPFAIDPIAFLQSPETYQQSVIRNGHLQKIDVTDLLKQMRQRVNYLESLESFLLANLNRDEMLEDQALVEVYKKTFAFSLANDNEKQKLAEVFTVVAEKVKQIDEEKRSYYGRALLGIHELEYIENWIKTNVELLSTVQNVAGMITVLWPMIESLATDNSLGKLIGEGAGLRIANLWCSEISYNEILSQANRNNFKFRAGSQERNLKIENIIDICDSSLGYDAMLVVGACADLLENMFRGKPEIVMVRQLQMALRIGLSDSLSLDLYGVGLTDRAVASGVAKVLRDSGLDIDSYSKEMAFSHRHIIMPELIKYPTVFTASLYGGE